MSAQPSLKTPPALVAAVLAAVFTGLVIVVDLIVPPLALGWSGTAAIGLIAFVLLWRRAERRRKALLAARQQSIGKGNEGGGGAPRADDGPSD